MRGRWLVVIAVASLCLNVAVIGTYFLRTARPFHHRHMPFLAPELREKLARARAAAVPEFVTLAEQAEGLDSLLWAEMRNASPDSVRVDSLCRELGQIHGRMRAMVFRQVHRELQMLPAAAQTEYLHRMMVMRPGFGGLAHEMGWRQHRGSGMGTHRGGRLPPNVPPGPPPESGR